MRFVTVKKHIEKILSKSKIAKYLVIGIIAYMVWIIWPRQYGVVKHFIEK